MSLHNNFSSKDELVVAYLDRRHAEWLGLLEGRTQRAERAIEGVLAVFDAYLDHAELAYAHGSVAPRARARVDPPHCAGAAAGLGAEDRFYASNRTGSLLSKAQTRTAPGANAPLFTV